MNLATNGRFLSQRITGVQRYGHGVSSHFRAPILQPARGIPGPWWEHRILPGELHRLGDPLLLNFCNTAPVSYKNQVVTIHDMAVFAGPEWFRFPFRTYYQWLLPRIAHRSRAIVTVSNFSKAEIVRYLRVPETKVHVIHSAPSTDWTSVQPTPPRNAPSQPFVLMVGSIDPRKNFDFAIEHALPVLRSTGVSLAIAGAHYSHFSRSSALETTNLVTHLQPQEAEEMAWLFRQAKAVIHPSLYEGFSLVPLEALAVGTPIVLSDIPAHREISGFRGGEELKYFFKPGDADSFQKELKNVLKVQVQERLPVALPYHFDRSASEWLDLVKTLA